MRVLTMRVGVVCMSMTQRTVSMTMRMTNSSDSRLIMCMLMVFVMLMLVVVFHLHMQMRVLMPFGEMQPDTKPHQQTRNDELNGQWFIEQYDRQHCAEKRRD